MFEWLFSYPRNDYQAGALNFASGWPVSWLIAAIVLVALVLAVSLWTRKTQLGNARLALIWGLQTAVAAVLLTMLWQPTLEVQNLKPGENTVSILMDRSGSMRYRHDGNSRIEQAQTVLTDLSNNLSDNFNLRYATVGDDLQWVEELVADAPVSDRSNISSSLIDALEQARSEPVAAIVLATDGSDHSALQSDENTANFWEQLQTYGVPVHTIGLGREIMPEDVEIVDVNLAENTLPRLHGNCQCNASARRQRYSPYQSI